MSERGVQAAQPDSDAGLNRRQLGRRRRAQQRSETSPAPALRSIDPSRDEQALLEATPASRHSPLWREVLKEVRWSFTPPCTWLAGVAVNLVLALLWLVIVPLTGGQHRDWAILVGTYFAVFILADVTTTNVLGADAIRVRVSLLRGVPLRRILLLKNLTLLIIVGLPTLLATTIITVTSEPDYRLIYTLPGVAYPMLTWVGVGNVISVSLPVAEVPLRQRWRERRQFRRTGRWLLCLALPYLLLYAVTPLSKVPRLITTSMRFAPTLTSRGVILCLLGLTCWGLGTALALGIKRVHPLRIR